MGTKNNPAEFDCYANAEGDEPMFVLLARDALAPMSVRLWVTDHRLRRGFRETGRHGYMPNVNAKEREALACADAMEAWREANRATEREEPKR
jgi:hypothetical protein